MVWRKCEEGYLVHGWGVNFGEGGGGGSILGEVMMWGVSTNCRGGKKSIVWEFFGNFSFFCSDERSVLGRICWRSELQMHRDQYCPLGFGRQDPPTFPRCDRHALPIELGEVLTGQINPQRAGRQKRPNKNHENVPTKGTNFAGGQNTQSGFGVGGGERGGLNGNQSK